MLSASKITNDTNSINTTRAICDGKAVLHINHIGPDQAFLVASVRRPLPTREGVYVLYREVAKALRARRLFILHEKVFGSISHHRRLLDARKSAFEAQGLDAEAPVTTIEGRPVWGEGVAGIVIHAVYAKTKGEEPWQIDYRRRTCGRGWRKNGFTHIVLQNLHGQRAAPRFGGVSRAQQITTLLQTAEMILQEQGAAYSDVVRTWFYLERIFEWYKTFNQIRNTFYKRFGIMPTDSDIRLKLPASTGIEGRNSHNAAAVLDLYAIVSPPNQPPCYEQLTSVGQMDAFRYGSAFSRGALIRDSDSAYITLSGTAAIDEKGATVFVDDPERQIACTFEKAMTLLASCGAALCDSAAAVAYIKHANHVDLFWKKAEQYGLGDLPVVCIEADICRQELLFELECNVAIGRR